MKTVTTTLALISLGLLSLFSGCTEEEPQTPDPIELTNSEKETLQFMIEEEKMARDVYRYLDNLYDQKQFKNISQSEQNHMDQILTTMTAYGVEDQSHTEEGKFNNPTIQGLYDELTAYGDSSKLHGFIVGATIEDVDIFDLMNAKSETSNMDLIKLYDKLMCGSRNHMRAFNEQVENNGGEYVPQYISTTLFEEILAGSHEPCNQL